MKKKIIKNIPNMITSSRIIASMIAPIMFILGNIPMAVILYVYGAVSDMFDGMAARKLNAFTKLGQKLDPISDKIFALSLVIPSVILGNYIMIIPLLFEAVISGINTYSQLKYKKTYTERVGKFKTAFLFPTAILALIATKVPVFLLALAPCLLITTDLQIKSIKAYKNQLNDNTNNKEEEKKEEIKEVKKLSNKDKLISLRNELSFYLNNSIELEKKDVKRKELKR